MDTYNYAVEWAVLPVVITIILSFRRDYDAHRDHYRYLKVMYYMAFLTSIMTVATSFFNRPLSSQWEVTCGYLVNALYFMILPIVAGMYGVYVQFTAHNLFSAQYVRKKIFPLTLPYVIYLVILLTNLHNGQIFSITQETGYVRGPLYHLPYPVVVIYFLMVVLFVARNYKVLARDTTIVISASMATALLIVISLFFHPYIIATGLLSTTCILILHLYVLNVRKTEDSMTGVQNRLALLHCLHHKIATNKAFSLYVFSIRGMKRVNDQYGLRIGDKKLYYMADVFLRHIPRGKIFRYSGDEFALVLPHHHGDKSPDVAALEQAFAQPVRIEGCEIPINLLTVRVDYPTFGLQTQDLISAADYGISLLKHNKNGDRYLYDITVAEEMRSQNAMMSELSSAIENHQLVVHYQPIYHVPTGTFTQAEALIRLGKRDGTLIHPDAFIHLANNSGLVVEMTYRLLEQVCQDFRYLLTRQPNTTLQAISINVPYLQFTMPDMEERFLAILQRHQISPNQIKIEVTERMLVTDFNFMTEKMKSMIDKGFEFELDDFGTDYSNLKMCLSLPLNIIKLDRSILLAALSSKKGRIFFQAMATAIHDMGQKAVLEGVETNEHLAWAKACKCEYIQGYYFSRPVDFKSFLRFLQK